MRAKVFEILRNVPLHFELVAISGMYVAERLRDVLVLIILGSCHFQG